MTTYDASNYPCALDTDANLYLVHDSLRVLLIEDYNPGDTSITVFDENDVLPIWPATGFITLTEQCSDVDDRAISFYYDSVSTTGFSGLVLLPGFTDVIKPANITNVTLNVMNYHHGVIKNALKQIQGYVGLLSDANTSLVSSTNTTIMGRLMYLSNLVLVPKAWFAADSILGVAIPPNTFTVNFTNKSFGTDSDTTYAWNIYQGITLIDSPMPDSSGNMSYGFEAGVYDIALTVSNEFGSNTTRFNGMITIRIAAPEEAVLTWNYGTQQQPWIPGVDGFVSIRTPTTSFVSVYIEDGINPSTGVNYSGAYPSDPITQYTWSMGDNSTHPSQSNTQALYSVGGIYDLVLRTDTTLGAYRITKHANAINVIEPQNLWLWAFQTIPAYSSTVYEPLNYLSPSGLVNAYEFGLLSETFKSAINPLNIVRSESFISGNENGSANEPQATTEFRRNTSFAPRGSTTSGSGGTAFLYWAGQGNPVTGVPTTYANHAVLVQEHMGFTDTYTSHNYISRPWNWGCLNSDVASYFLLGVDYSCGTISSESPTYQVMSAFNMSSLAVTSTSLNSTNYSNGALDLQLNPNTKDTSGNITSGNFSVYRSAWKGSSGYFLRNSAAGTFFRIKSFYQTQGTLSEEVQLISKLADMPGPTKLEGQLVSLSDGLFFFNNSGNISAYNNTSGVWETGGASASSASFINLQDSTNENFNNPINTLLATAYDRTAYLSYDYSPYAFIKFNSLELAFYNLGHRPVVYSQFLLGVY